MNAWTECVDIRISLDPEHGWMLLWLHGLLEGYDIRSRQAKSETRKRFPSLGAWENPWFSMLSPGNIEVTKL